MKMAKVGTCVALVAMVSVSVAGCGAFNLLNLGIAVSKLFSGQANQVHGGGGGKGRCYGCRWDRWNLG